MWAGEAAKILIGKIVKTLRSQNKKWTTKIKWICGRNVANQDRIRQARLQVRRMQWISAGFIILHMIMLPNPQFKLVPWTNFVLIVMQKCWVVDIFYCVLPTSRLDCDIILIHKICWRNFLWIETIITLEKKYLIYSKAFQITTFSTVIIHEG